LKRSNPVEMLTSCYLDRTSFHVSVSSDTSTWRQQKQRQAQRDRESWETNSTNCSVKHGYRSDSSTTLSQGWI